MKAMIFAAGLGTRLKPITDTIPKALVPVGGKTLLEHVITKLAEEGFEEQIINVHHHADKILDFLKEKKNFGLHIEISDERDMLLDTGGGIKKAAHFFDDEQPFLIHNVDILSNANLRALYDSHKNSDNIATLLVKERETSRYLLFDDNDRLKGWINTQTGEVKSPFLPIDVEKLRRRAFSGIHILSPKIFHYMETYPVKFPIMDFYIGSADKIKIGGVLNNDVKLIDVGKLDSLQKAEELLAELQTSTDRP
ncbi:MAG: nucleotidyltransferase family protein [Paludibacteraceae bacterium]|nr:nucleotidyltransferase family protein [Paludibacteraceae bacterium]